MKLLEYIEEDAYGIVTYLCHHIALFSQKILYNLLIWLLGHAIQFIFRNLITHNKYRNEGLSNISFSEICDQK